MALLRSCDSVASGVGRGGTGRDRAGRKVMIRRPRPRVGESMGSLARGGDLRALSTLKGAFRAGEAASPVTRSRCQRCQPKTSSVIREPRLSNSPHSVRTISASLDEASRATLHHPDSAPPRHRSPSPTIRPSPTSAPTGTKTPAGPRFPRERQGTRGSGGKEVPRHPWLTFLGRGTPARVPCQAQALTGRERRSRPTWVGVTWGTRDRRVSVPSASGPGEWVRPAVG